MKIYLNPSFVNTSESYSGDVLFNNNTIIVPYINLNLMEYNPINKHNSHIDYCYYVFNDVIEWELDEKIKISNNKPFTETSITEYIGIGGIINIGVEMKIVCQSHTLYILENSVISNKSFIPRNTPNFEPNMDEEEVRLFIANTSLPSLLGIEKDKPFHKLSIL